MPPLIDMILYTRASSLGWEEWKGKFTFLSLDGEWSILREGVLRGEGGGDDEEGDGEGGNEGIRFSADNYHNMSQGTDKAKITRKWSKPDKHGHGNKRAHKEPEVFYKKVKKSAVVNPQIIESKSKVRNSQNKAVVAKVSLNSSTPGISPDIAALTTEVSELKNMMKTMLIDKQKAQALAPVKAVEQSCVTCGGAHSYRNYPATDGNVYRDNIQEYVSQAAAANFNQGNTNSRPPMVFQKTEYFENLSRPNYYVCDEICKIRGQGFFPCNTVTNPKEDLKGITTRSGIAYKGHTIPTSSPRIVERRTEVTKDTVFPTNNGITEDVQPPVVPIENQNPVSEPDVAPVSAPMPNPKPSILYPSRRNDEKHRENANEQKEKFYKIFKDMSFEFSFMDALTLMPKFASTLKALFGNKEKTSRALIDVYKGELTLRVGNEAITFNLDQTSRYSVNYYDMTANRIDVVELACEEYSQEVLGFSDVIASGNPTPYYDSIVSNSSPTLTPFGDSDFLLLEEADAFLALADNPT
ncbi:hypothetical protein Tco_0471106, partial [Tanacetum coccineum]